MKGFFPAGDAQHVSLIGFQIILGIIVAAPWQLGIYKDELIHGLQEMIAAVHEWGGKIVLQLSHAGHFAVEQLIGRPPLVVSDFEGLAESPRKEITVQDIQEIVLAFADAARRAKSARFDGIQIHSAHGYLLNQFLSPAFNRRRDNYGGNVGNRARIHLEVYDAIRKAVGQDYPVLIKMNCQDFTENGLTTEDSVNNCLISESEPLYPCCRYKVIVF